MELEMMLPFIIMTFLGVTVSLAGVFLILSSYSKKKSGEYITSFEFLNKNIERVDQVIRDEIARNREESSSNAKQGREELGSSLKLFNDSLLQQVSTLTQMNEQRLNRMRETIEERLKVLQEDNNQKLEQMRSTVDEKLHTTLEKRLGESFKIVSDQLESVYKGLGEMQSLASGVGDLKKILTNVKTRGILGELQLENLLEQILTPDQYAKNVITKKGSNDRVEFAIRMPGREENNDNIVWLPIDAKFPREDYEKLVDAYEQGNSELADEAAKQLEIRIKGEAKDIREKYLDPPNTTDFGIIFLPIEGLYAEVLRKPGLLETLQREFRVTVAGPTTLTAFLNSLQMGFRTLAIQKRSSEVWTLLATVKTEFSKFNEILLKTQRKLQEASDTIESATKKSRTIERKLKDVQVLPSAETVNLIEEGEEADTENI